MNFTIKLNKIKSVDKIDGSWTNKDYINLLEFFEYPDAKSLPEAELFEMLSLALSDFEPDDAAAVVLKYKLGDTLNQGQIKSVSHEMLEDKIAEEYPDIALHYSLFNINQLLHDAYNGKFPRTLASIIDFELIFKSKIEITKEVVLRTMSDLLTEKSLLKRLFSDKLDSSVELKDAESIIWELKSTGENTFQIITSDYWINNEDFGLDEFSGVLRDDEIHHFK